jgi:hypothetical protein
MSRRLDFNSLNFYSIRWGYPKIRIGSPNTRERKTDTFSSSTQMTLKEIRNLLKAAQASKIVNPLTRALAPPFYRETKRLLHSETPSNLKNIPSVNIYMNVFYISYIYKPATSSHAKPELFEMTSLTYFLLIRESPHLGNLCAPRLPNSISSRFSNFADSRFRGFAGS